MDWDTGSRKPSCSKESKSQPLHLRSTRPRFSRAETRKEKCHTQNYWRQKLQRILKLSRFQQQPEDKITPTYTSPATLQYPHSCWRKSWNTRERSILRKGAKILRTNACSDCYPGRCTSYYSPLRPTNHITNPDRGWSNESQCREIRRTDRSRSRRHSRKNTIT